MSLPVNANPPQQRVSGTRLREGQEEMNGFMRNFAAGRLAPPEGAARKVKELDVKLQGLDQGSHGAQHEPEAPQDANSWMRQALREGREGNG